jgi:predicted nucleic acid-binding protein
MESHALIVYPTKKHQIVAGDPDDDAVVDCAVEAGADVIVSGDSHLTGLRQVEGIPVVTPAAFLKMLR